MYPDSYPGDTGEAMDSPELKLSVSDNLRASVTLSGDKFSHGFWAASMYEPMAVPDVTTEVSRRDSKVRSTAAEFSSLLDGSGDFL